MEDSYCMTVSVVCLDKVPPDVRSICDLHASEGTGLDVSLLVRIWGVLYFQ